MENEIIDFGSWNIPSSWDEVTLKQYQEIERFYEDNEDSTFDVRKVLHILCNKSIDEVNALPVEFTEKILNTLQFLSQPFPKVESTNKIVIDNVKYQINVFEKLKTGEYVATDTIIKSDKHNYAAMLAILCRKPSELYDSKFEAEVLDVDSACLPHAFVICLDTGSQLLVYRAWLAGCIQVAGGSFCGQVVGPQEFLCVGKEEVAVCLQMDESVVLEELAVAVEEERAGEAFRGLLHLGV